MFYDKSAICLNILWVDSDKFYRKMAHAVERPGMSELFVLNALLVFLSPYLALSFRPLAVSMDWRVKLWSRTTSTVKI